jgi:hypothetical protein
MLHNILYYQILWKSTGQFLSCYMHTDSAVVIGIIQEYEHT